MNKPALQAPMAIAILCFLSDAQAGPVLRLGYFPNLTHAQALYAKSNGEFEKATGVAIEWVSFNAGPSAVEALFIGAIDATFIGPGPTINGYMKSKGAKFVIVAGSASGGAGLVVRQDSAIQSDGDFNGKVIATPQLGNTQDLAARAWFDEHHYRLQERGGTVSLVPLSNPDQLTMFRKKQIDGAWTVEPWLSRLEIEGNGRLYLDEKTLWPDGRYATTELVMTKQYMANNEDVVRKLLSAHIEITQKINSDKAAAGAVVNAQLKKETGKALKEEVIRRALDRVEFTWDPIAPSLQKSADTAYRVRFLRRPPALGGLFALSPLNSVLREKGLAPIENSSN